MRIRYTYRAYPYSKRATDWSHLARLGGVFATLAIIAGVPTAIIYAASGEFSEEFWQALLFAAGGIGYFILYFKVIMSKIEEMAEEDRKELVRKSLPELKGKKIKLTKEDFEK